MRSTDINTLTSNIVAMLCKMLYASDCNITADTALADLGLDSLDLVEAGLELEAIVGHDMPDSILYDGACTIGELAASFAGRPAARHLSLAA